MKKSDNSTIFGRRREPHTVIIAHGNEVRHFTVRPWIAGLAGSALAAMAVGYLLATSYLVLRDDLIGGAISRQARMQQAYEDRISLLRAQVDRITSRQLLDQKLMETKVSELLERQSQLTARHGKLGPVLDRAKEELPASHEDGAPDKKAELVDPMTTSSVAVVADSPAVIALRNTRGPAAGESAADHADKVFVAINQSLRAIETDQMDRVTRLADEAYQSADTISTALSDAGLPIDSDFGKSDMGGPLIALDPSTVFDMKVKELDAALDLLDRTRKEAVKLPIANPAPGRSVSSTFGVRKDPLLGTPAMHSGMDFRAPMGFPALATAAGVVTKAEWNGGYGRMVEVDHGGGYATRYAHLSQIDVVVGQQVAKGDVVGNVGSSGRSTGPHLHYEVRRQGDAVDPITFLKVGNKIASEL